MPSDYEKREYLLEPQTTEILAIHVLAPCIAYRMKNPRVELPVIAVRSSLCGYYTAELTHKVDLHGSSWLHEDFGHPLLGTGGRAVAVLYTRQPITIHRMAPYVPFIVETSDRRKPEDLLDEIIFRFTRDYEVFEEPTPTEPTDRERLESAWAQSRQVSIPTLKRRMRLAAKEIGRNGKTKS